MEMEEQKDTFTEELITCRRCGEEKPRSEYRKVDNPTICLTCYGSARGKVKQIQVPEVQEVTSKHRVGVYMSPLACAILRAMSLRHKSDSDVVEQLLIKAYGDMSPQELAIVAYVQQQQAK